MRGCLSIRSFRETIVLQTIKAWATLFRFKTKAVDDAERRSDTDSCFQGSSDEPRPRLPPPMGDIQDWMRGVQAGRSTVPFHDAAVELPESDFPSHFTATALGATATRSRRPPALRFSSFLPSRRAGPSLKSPSLEPEMSVNRKDDVYNPDPDHMVNTLIAAVMSRPGKPLGPEYQSFLLHVFEAYRNLKTDLAKAQTQLQTERNAREMDQQDFDRAAATWLGERDGYKAEIKRLEVLMAEKAGGLEAVMAARVGSVVRRDRAPRSLAEPSGGGGLLGSSRTNRPGTGHSSMRQSLYSPSNSDITLSQSLAAGRHVPDPPFGTRPSQADSVGFSSLHGAALKGPRFGPASRKISGTMAAGSADETTTSQLQGSLKATGENHSVTSCAVQSSEDGGGNTDVTLEAAKRRRFALRLEAQVAAPAPTPVATPTESAGSPPATKVQSIVRTIDGAAKPQLKPAIRAQAADGDAVGHRRGFSFMPGDDAHPARFGRDAGEGSIGEVTPKGSDPGTVAGPSSVTGQDLPKPGAGAKSKGLSSSVPDSPDVALVGKTPAAQLLGIELQRDDSSSSTATVKKLSAGSLKGGPEVQRRTDPSALAAAKAASRSVSQENSPLASAPPSKGAGNKPSPSSKLADGRAKERDDDSA
ncbi:MAG: hypothetical protein M1832_001145 [Thelocarpon impressellum]|nr:MAG: hypothetical protein M1832_001145 [Thelocarpon impressellum]